MKPLSSKLFHPKNWSILPQNSVLQRYAIQKAKATGAKLQGATKVFIGVEEQVQHGCCWVAKTLWHRFLKKIVLILLMAAYTMLGGAVFYYFEKPHEINKTAIMQAEMIERRELFAQIIADAWHNCSLRRNVKCTNELINVLREYDVETGVEESSKPGNYNWASLSNAVWYAGTIYTTIGYGNLAPETKEGKISTIIYGLIGIPLMLAFLNDFGKTMCNIVENCYRKSYRGFWKLVGRPVDPETRIHFPLVVAFLVVGIYMIICGKIMMEVERGSWTYLDSFYFFFITLTTIGLGDVMPDSPKTLMYTFVLLIIGLALVAMIINMLHVRLEDKYFAAMDMMELIVAEQHVEEEDAEGPEISKEQLPIVDE